MGTGAVIFIVIGLAAITGVLILYLMSQGRKADDAVAADQREPIEPQPVEEVIEVETVAAAVALDAIEPEYDVVEDLDVAYAEDDRQLEPDDGEGEGEEIAFFGEELVVAGHIDMGNGEVEEYDEPVTVPLGDDIDADEADIEPPVATMPTDDEDEEERRRDTIPSPPPAMPEAVMDTTADPSTGSGQDEDDDSDDE
ncbi:hypothetical protein ACFL26_02095 [Patescibacteria group bacterium]